MSDERTPGPWSSPLPYAGEGLEITGDHHTVCIIPAIKIMDGAKLVGVERRPGALADAYLIGAAPELLALLEECVEDLEARIEHDYAGIPDYPVTVRRHERDMDIVVRAKAAIAKAKGERDE